ncbi:MAG: hypothetical protein R3E96_06470 [Planctomycetota bacterium]
MYAAQSGNQFHALGDLQALLKLDGYLLLCARFRKQSAQSGMLGQTGDGSHMYILKFPKEARLPDICSIFDEIPLEWVCSEAERLAYSKRWFAAGVV